MKHNILKRVFAVTLVVLTLSMIFNGCSSSDKPKNSTSSNGDNTLVKEDVLEGYAVPESIGGKTSDEFTIWLGWKSQSPDDTLVQKALREELGINYKCEWIQSDDVRTAINLKLTSGEDMPDMIVVHSDDVIKNSLMKSGRVMEVSDLFKSETLSTLPNIPDKIVDYVTEKDGSQYVIPSWYAMEVDDPWPGWTATSLWMRTDLMEKVGATLEDVATIKGFEDTLKKISKLVDENGKAIVPLSFVQDSNLEEVLISAFGVDTAQGVSGMPSVVKNGDEFTFYYDDPQLKKAYKWLNSLYTQGLLDMECTTIKDERMKEKVASGQVAACVGDIWNLGLEDNWVHLDKEEDDPKLWNMVPVNTPSVPGVEKKGAIKYVNPYPSFNVFINKDTKNLNAVVNYLEWALEPNIYRQHEVVEGPVGIYWNIINEETGEWRFEDSYAADRNSGDRTRVDACTTSIWQVATYSNKWYPWWKANSTGEKEGSTFVYKYCQQIGEKFKPHRLMKSTDAVKIPSNGVIDKNLPASKLIYKEYSAKMIMAKTEEDFEDTYATFMDQLERKANWSEMKKEWITLYEKSVTEKGEW